MAALIPFRLSDVAGNITGVNYVVDGGTIRTVRTGSTADGRAGPVIRVEPWGGGS